MKPLQPIFFFGQPIQPKKERNKKKQKLLGGFCIGATICIGQEIQ